MKKIFNTEDKARKHLEYRRLCAYSRIQKNNDKLLSDASFIYKNSSGKWVVFVQILTESMMKDIEEVESMFDSIYPLIPFTTEEQIIKSEKKLKQVENKYKTLDVERFIKNKVI